jgi:Eco57I restriction-modification methylase
MTEPGANQVSFTLRGRNPDVLSCIANLSNDEVFTPPEFANRMLDTLAVGWAAQNGGADLWADSKATFLDPCTKSGVFLREIAKRLIAGLEADMPDLQTRVDHVLTKQVFGIGITRLTSLLARRSLYCSKHATGVHSVAKDAFGDNDDGNIWFERVEHTWAGERCRFCRANKESLERGADMESHAYAFIHSTDIRTQLAEMYGAEMQFDVIIGNPPYQMKDGGHQASATPIYQKFIESAVALDPRFIAMVTPSRWFQGGRGLEEFRAKTLADKRMAVLVDFMREKDAFPKINVNGGLNFFLWDRAHSGPCQITTVEVGGNESTAVLRHLDEFDVFVRRNAALPILRKILRAKEPSFSARVSALRPFGLRTNFFGVDHPSPDFNIKLYSSGRLTWISLDQVQSNQMWVEKWKVLIAAATDGNETYPLPVWDLKGPIVAGPNEACSETYLVASIAANQLEAERISAYMRTRFFRFLVSLRKIAQHNKAENFLFVPDLPMDRHWTDAELYERYGITEEEISFIESMIRPMKAGDE